MRPCRTCRTRRVDRYVVVYALHTGIKVINLLVVLGLLLVEDPDEADPELCRVVSAQRVGQEARLDLHLDLVMSALLNSR